MVPLVLARSLAQPADPAARVPAKGDGSVAHAVPAGPAAPKVDVGPGPIGVGPGTRFVLTHTDLKTGAQK